MKVLVTGATSLIGRQIVERLVRRGDTITVLQRGASQLPAVAEVLVDLAAPDSDRLAQAIAGQDAIIHLAAKVGVSGRWKAFAAVNVAGTEQLLKAARAGGVRRFVHVSTPSVAHAGTALVGEPAGPADPTRVRGHYARSKAFGEQLALAANSAAMPVAVLRPHLVWGPGDTQLVQRIVDRARAGRLVLVGSGLALIDTTYIDNAADAIVAGLDRAEQAAGQPLVISNGQPRTVQETIVRILESFGLATHLRHLPAPLAIAAGSVVERLWDTLNLRGDPPMTRFLAEQLATAHWFDQRRTRAVLDWEPLVDLEVGFKRLVPVSR